MPLGHISLYLGQIHMSRANVFGHGMRTHRSVWDRHVCASDTYGLGARISTRAHICIWVMRTCIYIHIYTYVFMVRKSMLATQTHVYETEYVMSAAHVSEHRGFRIKDRRLRGYVNGNLWAVAWDLDLGLSAAVKR